MALDGFSFKLEGLTETVANLDDLSRATQRNVLRRALSKGGELIRDEAKGLVSSQSTRSGALRDSIIVSAKIKNRVGFAEFSSVLSSGGSIAEARSALRGARREAAGQGSFAEVYVGPASNIRYAHFVEFGTVNMPAEPFLRPAWDAKRDEAVGIITSELALQISKAAGRAARKAARTAARG